VRSNSLGSISVTELITVKARLFVNLSEAITCTESVSRKRVCFINKSESVSVVESISTTQGQLATTVSDSISIVDSPSMIPYLGINTYDSIVCLDFPLIAPVLQTLYCSVSNNVTIDESDSGVIPFLTPLNFDLPSISESIITSGVLYARVAFD
jgi:hypothetical protein